MLHTYFFLCIHKCTQLFNIKLFEFFFFRFCGCFSCSREVSRTRRNLTLALNPFENDLHSESYSRKINVKKISKNLYQLANSCVEFRKNSRFPQYFSKYTTFVHIFFYMCTQLTHNFHTCHFRQCWCVMNTCSCVMCNFVYCVEKFW